MVSVSEEDADYPAIPSIIGHSSQSESINQIKNDFINECQRLGIREDHYTIVYRGRKFGETHFGLMTDIELSKMKNRGFTVLLCQRFGSRKISHK